MRVEFGFKSRIRQGGKKVEVTIKRRGPKKVIVCHTGLSATWSLATPPTRRHPLHHQGTRIYREI